MNTSAAVCNTAKGRAGINARHETSRRRSTARSKAKEVGWIQIRNCRLKIHRRKPSVKSQIQSTHAGKRNLRTKYRGSNPNFCPSEL